MKAILSNVILLASLALPCTAKEQPVQDILPRSNGCRIETVNLVTGRRTVGQWHPKAQADSLRAEIKQKNIAQPKVNHYLVCI
jgi:hypothetical protein